MTTVRLNQKPFEKTFNSLFEDIFQHLPGTIAREDWNGTETKGVVPVNIRETADAFILDMIAPGLEKSDFKVNIEKNLLTVSAEKKPDNNNETEKMIRKEFSFRPFSRSFKLNDNIDASGINAKYEQGVLSITLPKKEEVKLSPTEINIQ
ncbi:MAG: Hsp20/alpha crystallin family protein [Chitinophagaceae bacterium]